MAAPKIKRKDRGTSLIIQTKGYGMAFERFKQSGKNLIESGVLLRWGDTQEENPDFSPIGPEIIDCELSAGNCRGIISPRGKIVPCSMCYKENHPSKPRENMNLETYKIVLDKLSKEPSPLTQIALGLTEPRDNPDLVRIMKHTRDKGIFPNFTITGTGLDLGIATDLADLCGGLAISCSPTNPDLCFDTVSLFTSLGVEQTNIHVVVSEESLSFVEWVISQQRENPKLREMNAIVCLMIKPKGRAKGKFHPPGKNKYKEMILKAIDSRARIGFDSCSAPRVLEAIESSSLPKEIKKRIETQSDPCESLSFSIYIDVKGRILPCSFCSNEHMWQEGKTIMEVDNFLEEVWLSSWADKWRERLLSLKRKCPLYEEIW